jgi:hypothetical protein
MCCEVQLMKRVAVAFILWLTILPLPLALAAAAKDVSAAAAKTISVTASWGGTEAATRFRDSPADGRHDFYAVLRRYSAAA